MDGLDETNLYHNVYGCYHTKKEILDTTNQDDDNTTFNLIEADLK